VCKICREQYKTMPLAWFCMLGIEQCVKYLKAIQTHAFRHGLYAWMKDCVKYVKSVNYWDERLCKVLGLNIAYQGCRGLAPAKPTNK